MKNIIVTFVLTMSCLASASYKTDSIKGDINCTTLEGDTVTVNAARDRIILSKKSVPYDSSPITERTTDGDTEVNYEANDHKSQFMSVTFSDRGDSLSYAGGIGYLTCPQ
jgi:hypothetical protein